MKHPSNSWSAANRSALPNTGTTWLSAHIYSRGPLDRLINLLAAPFTATVAACLHPVSPFFFIRYGEGGPHIRLRLHVNTSHTETVRHMLKEAAGNYFSEYPSVPVSGGEMPLHDTLAFMPYQQETARYGNQHTIPLAEEQFYLSSRLVMEQLQNGAAAASLTYGIQLHLCFFMAMQTTLADIQRICTRFIQDWSPSLAGSMNTPEQAALINTHMENMYRQYAPSLLPASETLWQQLKQGKAPPALQSFTYRNSRLLQRYYHAGLAAGQLEEAFCSMMHMSHNRLGLSNAEESWCVFLTLKCISHLYEYDR
ncbi:hypothetical protein ECE50_012740 [Chitinophaga sp. Mgbs1]|uniref:Thiopeptide-type bacteriocin biosynthesis domain-containing protein n=1 Tax=Chitinophaga solisilvae TaxID=1233460 RepID=A0A433WL85_9BACT|nr:hypothetical protein [Chitinophaga solisilvae]